MTERSTLRSGRRLRIALCKSELPPPWNLRYRAILVGRGVRDSVFRGFAHRTTQTMLRVISRARDCLSGKKLATIVKHRDATSKSCVVSLFGHRDDQECGETGSPLRAGTAT